MNIRQLEYFVTVSETLNFTRAAEKFYIAQSSITQQIKALEDELGVQLFYRNNRHVELTPAGRTFLDDARAILQRTRYAVGRAKQANTGVTGHLDIGYIKGYEKTKLSDLLEKFHSSYPNISLKLVRDNVAELYDGLLNSNLDFIFNLLYSTDDISYNLNYRIIRKYPLLAVMHASHPLAHRSSIRRIELKGYPLVDIKRENMYGEANTITKAFTDAGFLPEASYISDDIETSILAVAAGLGYALLPGYITDALSMKDNVIAVPLEGEEKLMTVIGAWNMENTNPAMDKFLPFFKDYLGN